MKKTGTTTPSNADESSPSPVQEYVSGRTPRQLIAIPVGRSPLITVKKDKPPNNALSKSLPIQGKNVSPPGKSRPNCKLTPLWKNGTYTASRESPSPVNPGTMYTPITVRTQLLTLRRSPRSKTVEQI